MRRRVHLALAALVGAASGGVNAQYDAGTTQRRDEYDEAITHPIYDVFAPRILGGAPETATRPAAKGMLRGSGVGAWPLLYGDDAWTVDASLAASVGGFAFHNNQFALPASQAASDYRNRPAWVELFVQPALTAQFRLTPATSLYGGAGYMETATRGLDYDGVGNTWHGDLEQLYAGVRWEDKARKLAFDVSYGQQNLVVGRSFLIAQGASNGPQRGADYIGPRAAWANAAIAKATVGDVTAQAFWLKPNDASSDATGTRLTGIDVVWDPDGPLHVSGMYVYAPESGIATRDGLNVYDVRARWHPLAREPNLWLQGEYAWERKSGVDAKAWYAALNYNAQDVAWKPLLTLRYAWFSGDKPGTSKWEGFDPLYFGGGDPDWYIGKLASTLFDNTNIANVAASITVTPDERNILQLVALSFRAVQTNSPLTVPGAYEPVATGGGVPAKALANEIDLIWTYTFDKHLNVNVFAAYATPGAGFKDLYASQGGSARPWSGIGAQLNVNY